MRVIDADMADVIIIYDKENELTQVSAIRKYIERQREFLDKFPTIDAVPVVRCRECIAYTPVDDNTGKCVFLIGKHQYVVPDGYCYLGERKEGADNDT